MHLFYFNNTIDAIFSRGKAQCLRPVRDGVRTQSDSAWQGSAVRARRSNLHGGSGEVTEDELLFYDRKGDEFSQWDENIPHFISFKRILPALAVWCATPEVCTDLLGKSIGKV